MSGKRYTEEFKVAAVKHESTWKLSRQRCR